MGESKNKNCIKLIETLNSILENSNSEEITREYQSVGKLRRRDLGLYIFFLAIERGSWKELENFLEDFRDSLDGGDTVFLKALSKLVNSADKSD